MDINTVIMDFPNMVPAFVVLNEDGTHTIFINSRLCREQQLRAYQHEVRHITNDDFWANDSADHIESINKH